MGRTVAKIGLGVLVCLALAGACGNGANNSSTVGVGVPQNPCGGAFGTPTGSGGVSGAKQIGALVGPTGGAVNCNGNTGAGANTGSGAETGTGPGASTGSR